MNNTNIRVRLAPSPTGFMHIGTLRVALYNYLFARKNSGTFVLRIEDTDQSRLVEGATENFIKTLAWCGLHPDEGPLQGGDYGPYTQSERLELYKPYIKQLLDKKKAYWCACTPDELDKMREYQKKNGQKLGYNGACREKNLSEGSVVRLKVPYEGSTEFNDVIRGKITIPNRDIDDQILLKSDGYPTYHLAVVVDDHAMQISHVLRGEEWISSTPKHILLYQAFGWEIPQYAHLPLLLNPDKSKLSKRQGDVAVEDYIQKGYLPEALLNFIALQGWNPRGDQEIYTIDNLIKHFDLSKINPSGAVVNFEKLDWMQGQYIKQLSEDELIRSIEPFTKYGNDKERLKRWVHIVKDRLVQIAEFDSLVAFLDTLPEYDQELLIWKKSDAKSAQAIVEDLITILDKPIYESVENCEKIIRAWIDATGNKNGDVLWPLRTALSGQKNSPSPFELMYALGQEQVIARIDVALKKLKQ